MSAVLSDVIERYPTLRSTQDFCRITPTAHPTYTAVVFCQVIEAGKGGRTHKVSFKQIAIMFQAVVEAYQQSEDVGRMSAALSDVIERYPTLRSTRDFCRITPTAHPTYIVVVFCQVIEAGKGGRTHKVSFKQIAIMFQAVLERLHGLNNFNFSAILEKIPNDVISSEARDFANTMLSINKNRLLS